MKFKFEIISPYGTQQIDEPIGWDDSVLTLKRDLEWHGIFFEYSLPLKFHGHKVNGTDGGYSLIKKLYNQYGIEAKASIKISWYCDEDDTFEELSTFKLNLSKVVFDEGTECAARVPIDPEGCIMAFRNRYETKVNIESTETIEGTSLPAYSGLNLSLPLPQKTIIKRTDLEDTVTSNYESKNYYTTTTTGSNIWTWSLFNFIPDGINLDEINTSNIGITASGGASETAPVITGTEHTPFLVLQEDGSYEFDIRLNLALSFLTEYALLGVPPLVKDGIPQAYYQVNFMVERGTNVIINDLLYVSGTFSQANPALTPITSSIALLTYAQTHQLQAGDRVYLNLYMQHRTSGSFNNSDYEFTHYAELNTFSAFNSYVKVKLDSVFPVTETKSYLINEVLSRTSEIITDDCLRVYSEAYGRSDSEPYAVSGTQCNSGKVLTTGEQIRRLSTAKPLTVSFKELFDNLNAIECIGIGIEENTVDGGEWLRVEPAKYFYKSTTVLQLDKIANITFEPATDLMFNKIRVGYQKWEGEEFSGLDEVNTTREYRTNILEVKQQKELIADFIAAGYTVEITRRKSAETDSTKDWKYDNDIFVICVTKQSGNWVTEHAAFGTSNLLEPNKTINLRITPVRNLLRWFKFMTFGYTNPFDGSDKLIFVTGTGNIYASTQLGISCDLDAGALSESGNLRYGKFNNADDALPPYYPLRFKFTYPLTFIEWKLLKTDALEVVEINWGANTNFVKTYIEEIKYRPVDGLAEFTLLLAAPPETSRPADDGIGRGRIGTSPTFTVR